MALEFGKPIPVKTFISKLPAGAGAPRLSQNQRVVDWLTAHPDQVLPVKFPPEADHRKFQNSLMIAVRNVYREARSRSDKNHLYIWREK